MLIGSVEVFLKKSVLESLISVLVIAVTVILSANLGVLQALEPSNAINNHDDVSSHRLPGHMKPLHYDLFLDLDLEHSYFSGNVSILVNVTESTSSIILHSRNLTIFSIKVFNNQQNEEVLISQWIEFRKYEFLIIELSQELETGLYNIILDFKADGFFYGVPAVKGFPQMFDNSSESVVVTALQPTEARAMFPCFDEPALKATYVLKVRHQNRNGYFTISNTPVQNVQDEGTKVTTSFEKSLPMSTYLLGILVSRYDYRKINVQNDKTGEPLELGFYLHKTHHHLIDSCLLLVNDIVRDMGNYTDVPYLLPKLDVAVIPGFANLHGYESWGLVTMSEALVYDGLSDSKCLGAKSLLLLAHETAHMWFGNLITMSWWDDLWLSEGFASFMSYKVMSSLRPNWPELDLTIFQNINVGMKFDSRPRSQPLVRDVRGVESIESQFSPLIYHKAMSLLLMLEYAIGSDNFQKAVSNFVKHYQFGSVTSADLIQEFKRFESGGSVKSFIESWTQQSGFPLIIVEEIDSGVFRFTQKRFKASRNTTNNTWTIPVSYVTSNSSSVEIIWFDDNTTVLMEPEAEWIKLKKDGFGFYIVNYTESLWLKLATKLQENILCLEPLDRYSLLSDARFLMNGGKLREDIMLEMLQFLKHETDSRVWYIGLEILTSFYQNLYGDIRTKFREFTLKLVQPYFRSRTWHQVIGDVDRSIVENACLLRLPECQQLVNEKLQIWIESSENATSLPDIYGVTDISGTSDERVWLKLWNIFDETSSAKAFNLLTSTTNVTLFERTLERAVNDSRIPRWQFYSTLHDILHLNPDYMWRILQESLDNDSSNMFLLNSYFKTLTPEAVESKLEEFFNLNSHSVKHRTSKQTLVKGNKRYWQWVEIFDLWLKSKE